MRISTKGLYATRLMLYLAQNGEGGLVPLKEACAALGISKKYLEQITPALMSARLLKSVRGMLGGYALGRPADRITFYDVLSATEGSLAPTRCLEGDSLDCDMAAPCMELPVWQGLEEVVRDYLSGITLQQVIEEYSDSLGDYYCI